MLTRKIKKVSDD